MQNKMFQHVSRHRVAYFIVALLIVVGAFSLIQSVPNFRGLNNNGLTGNIGDLSNGDSEVQLQDYEYRVVVLNGLNTTAKQPPIVFQSSLNGSADLYLVPEDSTLPTMLIASGVSSEMGQSGYAWKLPRNIASGEYRIGVSIDGVLDTTDIPFAVIQADEVQAGLRMVDTFLSGANATLDSKLDQLLRVNAKVEVKQVEVNNLIKQADYTEATLIEYVVLANDGSSTSSSDPDDDGMTNDLEYTSGSTSTSTSTDTTDGGFVNEYEEKPLTTSGDSTSTSDPDSDDLSDQDVKLSSQLLSANLSAVRVAQADFGSGSSEFQAVSDTEYTVTTAEKLSMEEIEAAIESLSLQLSREKLAIEVAQAELADLQFEASALQASVADYRVRVKALEQSQMELQGLSATQMDALIQSSENSFSSEVSDVNTTALSGNELSLEIESLESEVSQLEMQLKTLSTDLSTSQQEISAAQASVDTAQAEVSQLNLAIEGSKDKAQMAELELSLAEAKNTLNSSMDRLSSGKRINSAYMAEMVDLELELANSNNELETLIMEMKSLSTSTR